jgi:hypothetical protein
MIQLGKKQNSENSEENRSKLEELTGKKELLKDSISFVSKEVINRINNKNFKNDQEKALLINIKYILKSATRRDQFLKSSNPSSSSSSSQSPVSSSSSSSSSSFAAKENKKGSIDSESKSDINSISTEVGGGEEEKNSSI